MVFGIFPASGGLGGGVIDSLSSFDSAILIARKPEKLKHLEAKGASLRQADYDGSLEGKFEGIDTLLLISYASFQDDYRFSMHKKAIDSARKSGVKQILYTSLNFGGPADSTSSSSYVMRAHHKTEAYLKQLHEADPSFTFTSIREGLYSESYPLYTGYFDIANPQSTVKIPHSGSNPGISWVKQSELGEATAKLLEQAHSASSPSDLKYSNRTLILSGSREISLAETVEILAKATEASTTIEEVSVKGYANQASQQNGQSYGSGDLATKWATAFEGVKEGSASVVTSDLRELLGREPESFEVTVEKMAKEARK